MSKIKKKEMERIGDFETMKTEKTGTAPFTDEVRGTRVSGSGDCPFLRNLPQVYKKLEYLAFPIYLSIYLCTL